MDRRQFITSAAAAGAALGSNAQASSHEQSKMSAWVVGNRQGIGALTRVDLPELFQKNLVIRGISNASHRMLTDLVAAMDANQIEPEIARIFDFDNAGDALAYMARSSHVGKVVIRN